MAATPLVRPLTLTGVKRGVVVLSPSWPLLLAPQHFTPPPLVRAHACACPAAMATTPLERPDTATGVRRCIAVPSPSWPPVLLPQHFTPPLTTAHEKESPTVMAVTPLVSPDTCTGSADIVVDTFPNWPPLLSPQHFTLPPDTAHACFEPDPPATNAAPVNGTSAWPKAAQPSRTPAVSICRSLTVRFREATSMDTALCPLTHLSTLCGIQRFQAAWRAHW